jgi:hypothetical protein
MWFWSSLSLFSLATCTGGGRSIADQALGMDRGAALVTRMNSIAYLIFEHLIFRSGTENQPKYLESGGYGQRLPIPI